MTRSLRAVCVAGPSDAGKTTLVERLVERLSGEWRVATVKSIHHDLEPDDPGTDTHRHRTAGAEAAVGVTPSFAFEVTPLGDETGGSEAAKRAALADALARFADRGVDLALVEGFADAPLPTVSVGALDDRRIAGPVIATGDEGIDEILSAVRGVEPIDDRSGVDRPADDRTARDRRGAGDAAPQPR